MKSVDVFVIGSGPAAVAAMSALPAGLTVATATGTLAASSGPISTRHAKLRSVAYERREQAGLRDQLPVAETGGSIFTTAIDGGLANYWGQQFVRYGPEDPWPRDVFPSFEAYRQSCDAVERSFCITPTADGDAVSSLGGGFSKRVPRLLIGEADDRDAGLFSMRRAFRKQVHRLQAAVYEERVVRWRDQDGRVVLILAQSGEVTAKRILLAAGVVGSLRLTLESCPDLRSASMRDHAPYMVLTSGLDRIQRIARADGVKHFNSSTIERRSGGKCELFASVYRMGDAGMSLLFTAVGLPPLLRGMSAPAVANWVKPVQVWTEATSCRVKFSLNEAAMAGPIVDPRSTKDLIFEEFCDWLRNRGVTLRVRPTRPGEGFHYHAATVQLSSSSETGLQDFLAGRFGGQIVCVDPGVLNSIGCQPHTLTAMACARALAEKAAADIQRSSDLANLAQGFGPVA